MADAVSQSDGSKFYVYKAVAITVFVLVLALFPEYIQFHGTSWEVVQLIFVGIAVSYGLFSKKNEDDEIDNAQTYVSKLLQVSSVFDESENQTVIDDEDENKLDQQTWNSQYYRGEALKLVAGAKESPNPNREEWEKPLLLPVRSLKQIRVGVDDDGHDNRSKRFSNSHSFSCGSSSSSKMNVNLEEKVEDNNIVLPSPIPWRSRSGRLQTNFTSTQSSPNSQLKTSEDLMKKKKKNYQTFAPPPPPPPPPPPAPQRRVLSEPEPPRSKSVRTVRDKPTVQHQYDNVQTSDDDDDDDYSGSTGSSSSGSNNNDEAGRDVDKKADEFIAKFREQIRLQRIESIRKTTTTQRVAQNTSTSTSTPGS